MTAPLDGQIRTILKQELARLKEGTITPEDIPDDLPLFDVNEDGSENLGLDSLDAVELASALEQELGIELPAHLDFKELATINQLVAFVTLIQKQRDAGV